MAHAVVSLKLFDLAAPLFPQFFAADIIIGTFALMVFVALLMTSNTASQHRMNWKVLQRLVWFALPLAITHSLPSSVRFFGKFEAFGAFLLIVSASFVVYEGFSLWRSSAGRRKILTHVRLSVAGVAAAALLYVVLPTQANPIKPTDQSSSVRTSLVTPPRVPSFAATV